MEKTDITHIGVIIDGNRRWAAKNNMPASSGHTKGYEQFKQLLNWCLEYEIRFLTVYVFSTENYKRSENEITHIFTLVSNFFKYEKVNCVAKKIKFLFIGRYDAVDVQTRNLANEISDLVDNDVCLTVQVAIGYGGRDELVRAFTSIGEKLLNRDISLSEVNENLINENLDTHGVPDVELVIRTGGAYRLSNFLIWQSNYSEIFFSNKLWPDFTKKDFKKAIDFFMGNHKQVNGI